jgi:hypothetical protein
MMTTQVMTAVADLLTANVDSIIGGDETTM